MNAVATKPGKFKEPSLEKLAKQKAKGQPATNGKHREPDDAELKQQLGRLALCPPPKLSIVDQIWARKKADQAAPLNPGDRQLAILRLAKLNGNGHPALTGTTTPAGIAANDRSADGTTTEAVPGNGKPARAGKNGFGGLRELLRGNRPVPEDLQRAHAAGEEVFIECERIQPHPKNRHDADSDPDIVALAESIDVDGQLQAITVRPTPKAGRENPQLNWKDFEIVFGERRWRACRRKKGTVLCKIRTDLSDADVMRLIAIENGKRKDLNPIQRAQLIEELCQPVEEDGGGMNREQAAQCVGLKDGASASNLVRLLKLPKIWQARVAAGELPESFARLIVPVMELPPVMEHLDAAWKQRGKGHRYNTGQFESRAELERCIGAYLWNFCRRLDEKRYVEGGERLLKVDTSVPEICKELGLVEVEIEKKKVQIATNAKAFDEMLKKQADRNAKAKASNAGADKPASKKAPTPAQQKVRTKEQAEQLQRRIDAWRHDWLKSLVARDVGESGPLRERLLIAIAMGEVGSMGQASNDWNDLGEAVVASAGQSGNKAARFPYDALVAMGEDEEALHQAGTALVNAAILSPDRDPRYPVIEHDTLDEMASFLAIDLKTEWNVLQEARLERRLNGEEEAAAADRFACFFELFQTAQLDELGEELKCHVGHVHGKAAKIKVLTTRDRNLPLPKCIKPLAGTGGKKRKGRK